MKKLLGLFTAIILLSFTSGDELHFKIEYKPLTKYNTSLSQNTETTLTYHGSEDFLENLKSRGVSNPTITNSALTMESTINTGKLTDGGYFPIIMKINKSTKSEGKTGIPDGTIVYGKDSIGRVPILDSVVADSMTEDVKKVFLQTMQSAFTQISFPEKTLKTGEDFTAETPLSLPIAGHTLDMSIKTKYKLVSIADGIASFDIDQTYTMSTTITDKKASATGDGKGQLLYDIKNNFYKKYQVDLTMKMSINFDDFSLDITAKSGSVQLTTVTAN
jgi:hypothetical protein